MTVECVHGVWGAPCRRPVVVLLHGRPMCVHHAAFQYAADREASARAATVGS